MNPGTLVIVNLLGGVALLLWGVRMVRTGVMRAWGDRLKHFIEHRLGSRFSAFLAGGIATAILGSGTAMTLIVAGIAAAGAIGTVAWSCRSAWRRCRLGHRLLGLCIWQRSGSVASPILLFRRLCHLQHVGGIPAAQHRPHPDRPGPDAAVAAAHQCRPPIH